MAKKVIVLGIGTIGEEAMRQFSRHPGYVVVAGASSKQLVRPDGSTIVSFDKRGDPDEILHRLGEVCPQGPDLVVSALPSAGNNALDTERRLTIPFLKRGKIVIIAGKALVSEEWDGELVPYHSQIGTNATVGGSVGILAELEEHLRFDNGQHSVVDLVLNGTLSYIQSNVWTDRPLETVIREAVHLKFTEPALDGKQPNPFDVFQGEAEGDVPKKVRIILQKVYGRYIGRRIRADDVRVIPLCDQDLLSHVDNSEAKRMEVIHRLTAGNARKKHVVRISTSPMPPITQANSGGYVSANINNRVFVSGGFCDIPVGSPFDTWVPNSGPGNAVHLSQGGRVRINKGDGAGDLATVSTLMRDALKLCPPFDPPQRKRRVGALADVDAEEQR